jgi:hypothetical protein
MHSPSAFTESQIRRSGIIPLQFDDLKGVPGIDQPSTVTTEITGGPRPISHDLKHDTGASPKARKLLGWFRRASYDEQRRRSGIEEEDNGRQSPEDAPRAGHSVETTATRITVSYDIRRTVEELRHESLGDGSVVRGGDDIV